MPAEGIKHLAALEVSPGAGNAPIITDSATVCSGLNADQVDGLHAADILGAAWPVGSVFLSVVATDPATLLGFGTWAAIGTGRVLIGYDSGDADFNALEKTGGAKTVASSAQTFTGNALAGHNHSFTPAGTIPDSAQTAGMTTAPDTPFNTTAARTFTGTPGTTGNTSAGTPAGTNAPGAATSVVQPYLVVRMWKRTA